MAFVFLQNYSLGLTLSKRGVPVIKLYRTLLDIFMITGLPSKST